ncbi:hypothetical protein TM49_03915 [Martelella endophytica]|uniref:Uncharacterized protein n=1 Tax=Martelella endophytica TaxID=1486262 RepID=A0A0D5LMM6_MAREN|nr:hypothetical protein TM49_03915 [Martelella endophytica]
MAKTGDLLTRPPFRMDLRHLLWRLPAGLQNQPQIHIVLRAHAAVTIVNSVNGYSRTAKRRERST